MSNEQESAKGIPIDNTVAIVGDPGTGKTSMLLTFFRYGRKDKSSVVLAARKTESAHESFNNLFRCNAGGDRGKGTDKPKTLRCFISLENSFARVKDHHGKLLKRKGGSTDALLFIDASSLLSGRLEDRLRYAALDNSQSKDADACQELHLAPCGERAEKGNRCLFWQDASKANQAPKSLEQAAMEKGGVFAKLKEGEIFCLTLLTPPVHDPGERVRLLKDLLAAIFISFKDHTCRILALDSLSALLHSFDESGGGTPNTAAEAAPRRLSMLNLVRWLEEQRTTSFLACEARRSDQNTLRGHPLFLGSEERYLASGVIQLDYHRYRSGDLVRFLRVLKMRGAAHDMRPHAYDLSEKGIDWLEPLFGEAQQGAVHD